MSQESMQEHAIERTIVEASPSLCAAVVADVASYPEWAKAIEAAEVLAADDAGRPELVSFVAAGFGRRTSYTLRYDWSNAPAEVSWALEEGDVLATLDGSYRFEPEGGASDRTEVIYELSVGLAMPIPGFVRRRAETKILQLALPELKARVEAVPI